MPISPGFGSLAIEINALFSDAGERVVPISPGFGSPVVVLNGLLIVVGHSIVPMSPGFRTPVVELNASLSGECPALHDAFPPFLSCLSFWCFLSFTNVS